MGKGKIIRIVIFIAVTGLFLQFVYLPKVIQVKKLDLEYRTTKAGIAELYTFIGGEKNLKDNLIKMRDYAAYLEKTVPFEKEASNIIKQLNDEARALKINVISIKPGDLVNYADTKGAQLKVSDYVCKGMSMDLSVETRYQAIGDFLNKIELDKRPMICVRKIEIIKDVNILPKIRANIQLSACVLGE
jgi:Tfp pilus assembly protein PilO